MSAAVRQPFQQHQLHQSPPHRAVAAEPVDVQPFDGQMKGRSVEEKLAAMRSLQQQQAQLQRDARQQAEEQQPRPQRRSRSRSKSRGRRRSNSRGRKSSGGEDKYTNTRNDEEEEEEEDILEDGDLPSLQQNKSKNNSNYNGEGKGEGGGRWINGQRTTTRPLNPPSAAGLGVADTNTSTTSATTSTTTAAAAAAAATTANVNAAISTSALLGTNHVPVLPAKEVQKQRQFWNQFEPEEDEHEESSDVPDDERMDRNKGLLGGILRGSLPVTKSSKRRLNNDDGHSGKDGGDTTAGATSVMSGVTTTSAISGVTSAADPSTEGDDSASYYYQNPYAAGSNIQSGDHDNHQIHMPDLCTQTLAAIGDMCGSTTPLQDSPQKINKQANGIHSSSTATTSIKSPARSTANLRRRANIEEEHTAIEVEFVEPEPIQMQPPQQQQQQQEYEPPTSSPAMSSSERKSAFLSAMARKAKEDFLMSRGRDEAPSGDERSVSKNSNSTRKNGSYSYNTDKVPLDTSTLSIAETSTSSYKNKTSTSNESVSSDVYNRFTASDKRKFLKLINQGFSPAEASEQVLNERRDKNSFKSNNSTTSSKMLLSSAASFSSSTKMPSPSSARGLAFWRRGPTTSKEALEPENDNNDSQYEARAEENEEEPPLESTSSDDLRQVAILSSTPKGVAILSVPDLDEERVTGRITSGPADDTLPESDDTEEENDPANGDDKPAFAKSGINYYDGVRRRGQEDSDEEDDGEPTVFPQYSATSTTASSVASVGSSKRRSKLSVGSKKKSLFVPHLKQLGFTPLEEGNKDSSPKANTNAKPRARSAPRGGGRAGATSAGAAAATSTPKSTVEAPSAVAAAAAAAAAAVSTPPPHRRAMSDHARSDKWKDPELAVGLLAASKAKQKSPESLPAAASVAATTTTTTETAATKPSSKNSLLVEKLAQQQELKKQQQLQQQLAVDRRYSQTNHDAESKQPIQNAGLSSSSDGSDEPSDEEPAEIKMKVVPQKQKLSQNLSKQHQPRATVMSLAKISSVQPTGSFSTEGSDSIARMERDLLRPIPKEPQAPAQKAPAQKPLEPRDAKTAPSVASDREPPTVSKVPRANEGKTVKEKIDKEIDKPAVVPMSTPSENSGKRMKEVVQIDSLDVSIHTYMNSAAHYSTAMSHGHSNNISDNMSVYTTNTGISTMTQSSRVRRPGTAKERLAKARQGNTTPSRRGWHESIRAAAQMNNRVWDPALGWVDYKEHAEPMGPGESSREKIHLELHPKLRKAKPLDSAVVGGESELVNVPFPIDWEEERSRMLAESNDEASQQTLSTRATVKGASVPQVPAATAGVDSKSKGWHESMRVASLAVMNGQTWSPESGWLQNVTGGTRVGDNADFNDGQSTITSSDLGPSVRIDKTNDVQPITRRSPSPEVAAVQPPAPTHIPGPVSMPAPAPAPGPVSDPAPTSGHVSVPPPASAPGTASLISQERAAPVVAAQAQSSVKAVSSAGMDGKYTQLGDSGSVRSYFKDVTKAPPRTARLAASTQPSKAAHTSTNYISDDEEEDDHAPLLEENESFPAMTMTESLMSPPVHVVKQKVNEDDMDLFPLAQEKPKSTESYKSSKMSKSPGTPKVRTQHGLKMVPKLPTDYPAYPPVSPVRSAASGSTGRRSGPVDLDDDIEVSQDEDADESSNFDVSSSSSAYAKHVPRLRRSRRDTAPAKEHNSSDFLFSTSMTPTAADSLAVPITPDSHGDEGSMPSMKPQQVDPINETYEPEPRKDDARVTMESTGSNIGLSSHIPSVKARLHQWEARYSKADEAAGKPVQEEASVEWKTFLDKKVSAETAAALSAKQNRYLVKEPTDESQGVDTGLAQAVRRERASTQMAARSVASGVDDDTLFDFRDQTPQRKSISKSSAGGHSSAFDLSEESPIEPRGGESDDGDDDLPVSEAYGPAPGERSNFFRRLVECSAPIMPKQPCGRLSDSTASVSSAAEALPAPATLKSSADAADAVRYVAPSELSKRRDKLIEEYIVSQESRSSSSPAPAAHQQERSHSAPRAMSRGRDSSVEARGPSSVVSDEFGAKTAYLEAIAAKTAVSKPSRRSSSRRRSRSVSGSSVASTASSQHSEKWKAFLERKKAGMISPPKSRETDVSRAAEKYAAEKVEEMMKMMSTNQEASTSYGMYPGRDRRLDGMIQGNSPNSPNASEASSDDWKLKRAESVRAAEDLAAARVEAMMAALSGNHPDEGEI